MKLMFCAMKRRLLVLSIAGLVGCSPSYVMHAAYHQGKILLGRRQIEQVLMDADTSSEDKEKLKLVLEARAYATQIGLHTGRSFTAYTDIGTDTLAWVVVASRKDSFSLHSWWFPIVGRVPYKGFFDEQSAHDEAQRLEAEGYESCVRGTEAFSTLGWFNDPLLSTTLKNPPVRVVNTVLHENVHSTVWIKDNVSFNESLANFVGAQATLDFFTQRQQQCRLSQRDCALDDAWVAQARLEREFQLEFGDVVTRVYDRLDELYQSNELSADDKIARRVGVFEEVVAPFRARFPRMTALQSVNNAEIVQLKLYLTSLRHFERLFAAQRGSWEGFFEAVKRIRARIAAENSSDPFQVLQEMR